MPEWMQHLIKLKIPNLVLILILFYFGTNLILGGANDSISARLVLGIIIVSIAIILSLFFYVDYRNREHLDFIVSHYKKALESISNTHSVFEEKEQKTLTGGEKIGDERGGIYSPDSGDSTMSS